MSAPEKTIDECIKNIQEFADKFGLEFTQEGECGFGRECVGLMHGEHYLDYNPTSYPDCDSIEELYDERLDEIKPKDAYHKHDCFAVLGRGDNAIRQLSDWIDKLKEFNPEVVDFETGATGLQVMFSGTTGKSVKIPK